jgi:hypothetical protein
MNTVLEHVEETLAGLEPAITEVPGGEIPDYLPAMSGDNNC